jgi:hypothetical protein
LYQHGKTAIADEAKGVLKISPVLLCMIVKHNYFLLQLEKEKEASAINPDDFMAKTEKLYKAQVIGEQLFKNNPHFL